MIRAIKLPDHLKRVFRRDESTGNFIVEILLERYIYAFNEWDSSYFKRRDLDPDLVDYLENCSEIIPRNFGMDLVLTVYQKPDEGMEKTLTDSIHNFFTFNLFQHQRSLSRLYIRAAAYIALSLGVIMIAVFAEEPLFFSPLGRTLLEGLYIGGWVFLWEAISLLSFNRGALAQKIRENLRLSQSRVLFVYRDENTSNQDSQISKLSDKASDKKETITKMQPKD